MEKILNSKDMVFFGKEGFTSTSMNHICNMAKELYVKFEKMFNYHYYSTSVKLLLSDEVNMIDSGMDNVDFNNIPITITYIAELKALIAYGREAIKAKNRLHEACKSYTEKDYAEDNNIILPVMPSQRHVLTEDDIIGSMTIKERTEYYTLEAKCATLGQLIHPDGKLSLKRQDLHEKTTASSTLVGSGRDAMVYKYTPTVSVEDVDRQFFALQAEYRESQARLNKIKSDIDRKIKEDAITASAEYQKAYEEYIQNYRCIVNQKESYVLETSKKILELKIVLPDNLKGIYNALLSEIK